MDQSEYENLTQEEKKMAHDLQRVLEIAHGLLSYAKQNPARFIHEAIYGTSEFDDSKMLMSATIRGKRITITLEIPRQWVAPTHGASSAGSKATLQRESPSSMSSRSTTE